VKLNKNIENITLLAFVILNLLKNLINTPDHVFIKVFYYKKLILIFFNYYHPFKMDIPIIIEYKQMKITC